MPRICLPFDIQSGLGSHNILEKELIDLRDARNRFIIVFILMYFAS